LGIPQHRERVYILGIRNDIVKTIQPFQDIRAAPCSIETILTTEDSETLSRQDLQTLECWEVFIQHFKFTKLPTFPIWTDVWDSTEELDSLPKWKRTFIEKNKAFYETHKEFLEGWLKNSRNCNGFIGAKRKLEWQCGTFQTNDSLWNLLFQFRPSGIRVKRPNYSPALVAMAQIVVVGSKKRKLTPREVARLQSFPDSYTIHENRAVCYKQFGNSVNVEVVKTMAKHLLLNMNL
jgi:DNA (cytosine-5)-methyltransferase 1